jgi:phosphonate degradation associated HDIG domain protein
MPTNIEHDFDPVGAVFALFATPDAAGYFGERVNQLEHALQTARLAERESASNTLVVAALLHDIGHLLALGAASDPAPPHDVRHELVGTRWVARYFGAEIAEPIHLHVAAKRYLCAIDPAYIECLSPASKRSLALQGGPMHSADVARYERLPFGEQAARLRRWDDRAKLPGLQTADLAHYRQNLNLALLARRPGSADEFARARR